MSDQGLREAHELLRISVEYSAEGVFDGIHGGLVGLLLEPQDILQVALDHLVREESHNNA